jgi:predicted PurR-regulated permease PerM
MELLEDSVARSFGGFVRGQVVLGVVYGAFAGLTSIVLGLPYMPLIALIVGLIHAVPFFGPFVSWLPPVLVAVLFVPGAINPAIVIMGTGMLVTMNLMQPRLMGQPR